jgi:hypothetical protein
MSRKFPQSSTNYPEPLPQVHIGPCCTQSRHQRLVRAIDICPHGEERRICSPNTPRGYREPGAVQLHIAAGNRLIDPPAVFATDVSMQTTATVRRDSSIAKSLLFYIRFQSCTFLSIRCLDLAYSNEILIITFCELRWF